MYTDARKLNQQTQYELRKLVGLLVLGVASGVLLQKYQFLDLEENAFYQNYVVDTINKAKEIFKHLNR